ARMIAIHTCLQLGARSQPWQQAHPRIAAKLNTRQIVRRVGVVAATGWDKTDRTHESVDPRLTGETEFLVQDEMPHAHRPRSLVAAIGCHPAAPPIDFKAVKARLIVDLLKVCLVKLRKTAKRSKPIIAEYRVQVIATGPNAGARRVVELAEIDEFQTVRRRDLQRRREPEPWLVT